MHCPPTISFSRAHQRMEGLHSDVIKTSLDHELSTSRFIETAKKMNWTLVDTSPPQDVLLTSVLNLLCGTILEREKTSI